MDDDEINIALYIILFVGLMVILFITLTPLKINKETTVVNQTIDNTQTIYETQVTEKKTIVEKEVAYKETAYCITAKEENKSDYTMYCRGEVTSSPH